MKILLKLQLNHSKNKKVVLISSRLFKEILTSECDSFETLSFESSNLPGMTNSSR